VNFTTNDRLQSRHDVFANMSRADYIAADYANDAVDLAAGILVVGL